MRALAAHRQQCWSQRQAVATQRHRAVASCQRAFSRRTQERASPVYRAASTTASAEAVDSSPSSSGSEGEAAEHEHEVPDLEVSHYADAVLRYTFDLARTSEVYTVHSWMLLLGILKYEECTAAKVLQALGLTDLRSAWNEVLWALNVCDGLKPRPFRADVGLGDRCFKVLQGATNFAHWSGRDKVQSEDILLALSTARVLDGLFPDLDLGFSTVRHAIEVLTGSKYELPYDDELEPEVVKEKSDEPAIF